MTDVHLFASRYRTSIACVVQSIHCCRYGRLYVRQTNNVLNIIDPIENNNHTNRLIGKLNILKSIIKITTHGGISMIGILSSPIT
jgi:hypothetical protein